MYRFSAIMSTFRKWIFRTMRFPVDLLFFVYKHCIMSVTDIFYFYINALNQEHISLVIWSAIVVIF